MNRVLTRKQLERHEGRREYLYDDATSNRVRSGDDLEGAPTIGVGYNLAVRPLPDDVINRLANLVIQDAHDRLCGEQYFHRLNDPRQAVLVSMVVNLGWHGFQSFSRMQRALRQEDYESAADEMRDSRWFGQVGRRGEELANQMETGVWHPSVMDE